MRPLTVHDSHDNVLLDGLVWVVLACLLGSPALVAALALCFAWNARWVNCVAHLVEGLLERAA